MALASLCSGLKSPIPKSFARCLIYKGVQMKSLWITTLISGALIFTGCGENEDKNTSTRDGSSQQQEQNQQNIEQQEANERMGDVTKKDRGVMLWKYKFDKKSLVHSQVPAIDEKGNIYFSFNSDKDFDKNDGKFTVTSLDKNGKERWVKTFKNTEGNPKIMYKNSQIFFTAEGSTSQIELSKRELKIYSLNASNGDVKWSINEHNRSIGYMSGAISNGKLYAYMADSDMFNRSSMIVSYDLTTGAKKDTYQISTSEDTRRTYAMSIFSNHIYLLTKGSKDCIRRVDDIDDTLTKSWETCDDSFIDMNNSEEFITNFEGSNFVIDSQENIYLSSSNINKYSVIYSIDKYGEFRWRKEMESTRIRFGKGLTIDKNDNIYSSVPGDRTELGYLFSLSSQGDENWRLDNSYFDSGEAFKMDYQNSPTIGSNGNIYSKVEYGLNSVKSSGALDWKYNSDNSELLVSSYSTINTDGNIIAIGLGGGEIACYKGDGTTLEPNGWSKLYGNAGNTSSR